MCIRPRLGRVAAYNTVGYLVGGLLSWSVIYLLRGSTPSDNILTGLYIALPFIFVLALYRNGVRDEINVFEGTVWGPTQGVEPRTEIQLADVEGDPFLRRSLWNRLTGIFVLRSIHGKKLKFVRFYYAADDWAEFEAELAHSARSA